MDEPRADSQRPDGQRPDSPRAEELIVVLDERLRKVILFYISLFPNYREAGRAIGVGKDTIAKYAAESTNMSLAVYRRMVAEIESRSSRDTLSEAFGASDLSSYEVSVQSKNGSPIDHVMFEITPPIRDLILHYTESFENRTQAARALDLNPRTLKAYTNGQISKFPRSRFHRMVEVLKARGESEQRLLEIVGTKTWKAALNESSRPETLHVEQDELLDQLADLLEAGEVDVRKANRPVYNAGRRVFGSIGTALDAAMERLAERVDTQAKELLAAGEIEEARERIVRLERALRSYVLKVRARTQAARKESKQDWRGRLKTLVAKKDEVKEAILKESQFHPATNGKTEEQKLRFAHPYLASFRSYQREQTYDAGELIFHPLFGMGRVVEHVERGQMKVKFGPKAGTKILAFKPPRFV